MKAKLLRSYLEVRIRFSMAHSGVEVLELMQLPGIGKVIVADSVKNAPKENVILHFQIRVSQLVDYLHSPQTSLTQHKRITNQAIRSK